MPKFRPPHVYQANTIYFLTGRTVQKISFFDTPENKNVFLDVLTKSLEKDFTKLFAFVINNNHYHLLLQLLRASDLNLFIQNLHTNTARLLNKANHIEGRTIWYQYWDRCIRGEKDFWIRFNYIHHNPVKHGLVTNQDELKTYKFCSYHQWLQKKGIEWLDSTFEMHPIKDFTLEHDD